MFHNIVEYCLQPHKHDVIDKQYQSFLTQDVNTLINVHKLERKYDNVLASPTTKKKHILLLYEEQDELDKAIVTYLNDGLARGQFCIYITFKPLNENYCYNSDLEIQDCQKNMGHRHLIGFS